MPPAVATGVAAGLRMRGKTDVRVVAQGGDGGTTDIGFGCLSGMFERNDDVLYICYDNEAYMNTGVQRSSATPPAARTATTPAVGDQPGNVFGTGKNLPLIAMAHNIPYVATASVADLHDLEAKVAKAMTIHGARYLHVMVPCPLGWGSASELTIRIARLAVESGLFPLFEAEHGEVVAVSKIRRKVPVEDYLRPQRRFAHLFRKGAGGPRTHRRDPAHGRRQHRPLRPARPGGKAMKDTHLPFAITLDPGIEPAQPDRFVALGAAGLSRPAAALQQRLPGRREHPGLALSRRERRLCRRLAGADGGQPVARGHGAGLLSSLRRPPATAASSTRR